MTQPKAPRYDVWQRPIIRRARRQGYRSILGGESGQRWVIIRETEDSPSEPPDVPGRIEEVEVSNPHGGYTPRRWHVFRH